MLASFFCFLPAEFLLKRDLMSFFWCKYQSVIGMDKKALAFHVEIPRQNLAECLKEECFRRCYTKSAFAMLWTATAKMNATVVLNAMLNKAHFLEASFAMATTVTKHGE